ELRDVTTGELLWSGAPTTDRAGRVTSFPLARFYKWYRLGLHVVSTHRYRVTAIYDNPTGHVIRDGGMGAVAGLFVPDRGAVWPGTGGALSAPAKQSSTSTAARSSPPTTSSRSSRSPPAVGAWCPGPSEPASYPRSGAPTTPCARAAASGPRCWAVPAGSSA